MNASELIGFLTNSLFVAGGVATGVGLLLIVYYLYRRRRWGFDSPTRVSQGDLANMMILFQTMRDILEQQKDLARQLNESLDRKVKFIKETVDSALRDLDLLRDPVKRIAGELASVTREIAASREASSGEVSTGARQQADEDRPKEPTESRDRVAPRLEVLARPVQSEPAADLLEKWVGLDFAGDEPEPIPFQVPEEPPTTPEDPLGTRKAFRTLLNLEEASDRAARTGSTQTSNLASGNGRGRFTPLQARIYEYRDAGMTIAQIAHELGIGKGEVRLILSLRKERS